MVFQSNIHEGQKFYVKLTGNLARHNKDGGFEAVVDKVGRKYFTLKVEERPWFKEKFHVEDLTQVTNYSTDYVLYNSRWDYEKMNLKPKVIDSITELLKRLTYEQVLEVQNSLIEKYV
jgi:hypothetical protein